VVRFRVDSRRIAIALAMVAAWAAGAGAQDLTFADPATTTWAGQVRDRLATRDSLEGVYQRTSTRASQLEQELVRLRSARPGYGQDPAQFQYQVQARAAQIQTELAQSQTLLSRTQQRLDPVYTALRRDQSYASQHQDPAVRQSVGSLIATAGHGLDPIWIRIPQVYNPAPPAGGGAIAASGAGSASEAAAQAAGMGVALSGSAQNVAASGTRASASAIPQGAIFTMEVDKASNMMVMIARDGTTKQAIRGVLPFSTGIQAGADATSVAEAGRTIGQLRRSAWVAETGAGGGTTFRSVDWKTRQPIDSHQTLASENAFPAANRPANTASTATATPAATGAGSAASAPRALWTMEADAASGMMQMIARDPVTKARLTELAPVATGIRTGADATSVADAGRSLGQLRRSAWVAETGADGGTTFRSVDWKTRQPIDAHQPIATAASTPAGTSAPQTSGTAAAASRLPVRTPAEMTAAVWTPEANPASGTMVLRARDAVTNQHLAGYRPVETSIPNPARGEAAAAATGASRTQMRDVVYRASQDGAGKMVFRPESRSGGALPEGVKPITHEAGAAAPSRTAGGTAASETAAAEGAKRGFQMPSMKAVAASAVKWGGLSVGITLASNVATQFVQNKGKVDWGSATDFLRDGKFWGGTAGGFVGAMAGGAIAAAVPGGPFVKALLSIGGASVGHQIGSGQIGKTDWLGLGVTTLGSAAGTALGMSVGGPVGALVGGIAGQMLTQFVYDKVKDYLGRRGDSGPVAQYDQGPAQQQQQGSPYGQYPPGLPGAVPNQIPGGVSQIPGGVSQVPPGYGQGPAQDPAALQVSIAQLTQRMNQAYQEQLAAHHAGNSGMAYQKSIEYQTLRNRLDALRRAAYQDGSYGDHRYSR
jgi:hypothetical protein